MAHKMGSMILATIVSNTDLQVLSPSETRCAVMFRIADAVGTMYVANYPMSTTKHGIYFANPAAYLELWDDYYGDLVRGPWHLFGNTTGDAAVVIEVLRG